MIFGRGGYGNLGTVIEFERCFPLLSKFTNFSVEKIQNYSVTLVFYEGNDLNNNLVEMNRNYNNLAANIRFILPVSNIYLEKCVILLNTNQKLSSMMGK